MEPNNSKNTAEDDLQDKFDFSSFSSAVGMDKNEMTEKIRKLEAELHQIKEANSNQFSGNSMMQLGIQIGEMKKEIDGLKSAMVKMNEEFAGKNAELEEQIAEKNGELKNLNEKMVKVEVELEGMKRENKDLKEKVGKLAEENGKMKAAKDEENAKFEELKAAMARMKEEFSVKNNEFEGKMRELQEQKTDKEMVGNLTGRIDEMGFIQMKNNKWNAADCGPRLVISEGGLVVTHSGNDAFNCIRAVLPIRPFNLDSTNPSIAGYFEVQIIHKNPYWFGHFGFCTQQFPLERRWLGNMKNSIGIYGNAGMYIDGQFKEFGNAVEYFKVGDVIGVGIIRFPANKSTKCFATLNGQLLGTFELPDKFASLQLFPAINLHDKEDSFRANFGQQKWRFDPFSNDSEKDDMENP